MSKKVDIRWTVEDGYVGGARPQYSRFDLCDFDGLETEEQVREYIEDVVSDDFQSFITFSINESSVEDAVEEIMAYLKDEDSNEDDEQD